MITTVTPFQAIRTLAGTDPRVVAKLFEAKGPRNPLSGLSSRGNVFLARNIAAMATNTGQIGDMVTHFDRTDNPLI